MSRFENARNILEGEMNRIVKDMNVSLNLKTENIMKIITTEDIAVLACAENFDIADTAIMRFIKNNRNSEYPDAYIEIARLSYINAAEKIAVANLNNKE